MQRMLATSNGFMAKNSEGKMTPDTRDSTKPSISLLETEEDHHIPIIKGTTDTRPTTEEDSTTETKDTLPPLKVETTWISML